MGRKSINYISVPVEVNPPNDLTAMNTRIESRYFFLALLISRSSVSKYMLWLSQYVCSIQGLAHVKIVTNTGQHWHKDTVKRWVFESKPESRDRGTQIHDDTKIKLRQCLIQK